jgi:threonine dehydrogenase-like Zn-dependent dehydrogenase
LQAEQARVPFANAGLIKLPDHVTDDQAILLSDIFPTGYFGAELAEIRPGNTVAVFGCGPVGQFAIVSARLLGAARIFAVDNIESRLEMAQAQGAEIINFDLEDPVETLLRLTGGIGPDRVIDAVGVDAVAPSHGPAKRALAGQSDQFEHERGQIAPTTHPRGENWHPGDAPSLVLSWAIQSLAKAGTLAIIGVYPQTAHVFPIGAAMNKNLTVKMGNCHHRRYIPTLLALVANGTVHPEDVLTQTGPLYAAVDAYKAFDTRQPGWMKVKLEPEAAPAGSSRR